LLCGLNPRELLFELEQNSADDHDEEGKGDDCSQPIVDFASQAVQGLKIVPTALICPDGWVRHVHAYSVDRPAPESISQDQFDLTEGAWL